MRTPLWVKKAIPPLLVVAALLVAWQVYVSAAHVSAWLLPSPWQVVRQGWDVFPRIARHAVATLRITVIGFGLGALCGIAAAVLLHGWPKLKPGFYPLLVLSQNVPLIVLAPLLTIWFGFGLAPKIIIITLVCFFPVTVAMLQGLEHTDREMLNYMRMIGAGRRQIFVKLEFPYALPHLFSGLKISATYSVMGAVVAEWSGAANGLGVYMMLQKSSYRADRLFVAIVTIVAISLALFVLIHLLEKWLIRWKPPAGEERRP